MFSNKIRLSDYKSLHQARSGQPTKELLPASFAAEPGNSYLCWLPNVLQFEIPSQTVCRLHTLLFVWCCFQQCDVAQRKGWERLCCVCFSFRHRDKLSCWRLFRWSWWQAERRQLPIAFKLVLCSLWPPDILHNVVEGIWLIVKGRLVRIKPNCLLSITDSLCLAYLIRKLEQTRMMGGSLLGLLWHEWMKIV